MAKSIRSFLLGNLLLSISIAFLVSIVVNYFFAQKEALYNLDRNIEINAHHYATLLQAIDDEAKYQLIADTFAQLASNIKIRVSLKDSFYNYQKVHEHLPIQVWTQDNSQLLLTSIANLKVNISSTNEGFSYFRHNGKIWRVYTKNIPNQAKKIAVGYSEEFKQAMIFNAIYDDVIVLLILLPLATLMIWIIIGKGLSSFNRVKHALKDRAPTYLEPFDIEGIPQEIKPVIEELNLLLKRLKQGIDREKRFAADAAHELKTPLAAMKTQAQVALRTANAEERNAILRNLLLSVDRSTHTVQQLLTISQLGSDSDLTFDKDQISLTSLSTEITAQLANSAINKNIEIELNSHPQNVFMLANAASLSILIRNLIDNAIRYTPENGRFYINIEETTHQIIFSVADNGPGIDEALYERVFERCYRVLGNRAPGSGLGLSIVQQIADLHNAKIKLQKPLEHSGLIVSVYFSKV